MRQLRWYVAEPRNRPFFVLVSVLLLLAAICGQVVPDGPREFTPNTEPESWRALGTPHPNGWY